VVRQGITTKMESQLDYMGDLVVSMMLMGGGVLRPECAIELTLDNLDN